MSRLSVVALSLTLISCGTDPPLRQLALASMAPVGTAAAVPFDLRVANLPVRPAGAAFAMAGQEHALVRLLAPAAPIPVMPEPSLAAHVLAVQAAYQRWCNDAALPGDTVLLSWVGGLRLPRAIACTPQPAPSMPSGAPRRLIPTAGSASRRRSTSHRHPERQAKRRSVFLFAPFLAPVKKPQTGVFEGLEQHRQTRANPARCRYEGRSYLLWHGSQPSIFGPPFQPRHRSNAVKTASLGSISHRAFEKSLAADSLDSVLLVAC